MNVHKLYTLHLLSSEIWLYHCVYACECTEHVESFHIVSHQFWSSPFSPGQLRILVRLCWRLDALPGLGHVGLYLWWTEGNACDLILSVHNLCFYTHPLSVLDTASCLWINNHFKSIQRQKPGAFAYWQKDRKTGNVYLEAKISFFKISK